MQKLFRFFAMILVVLFISKVTFAACITSEPGQKVQFSTKFSNDGENAKIKGELRVSKGNNFEFFKKEIFYGGAVKFISSIGRAITFTWKISKDVFTAVKMYQAGSESVRHWWGILKSLL